MKRKLSILLLPLACALALVGCGGFINGVKNTRATAVDLAYGGYTTWTNYYSTKTNQVTTTPDQLAALNQTAATVKDARLKFAATIGVLDGWIGAYQTNSAVKPQLQAVLDSTISSASNFVWLVNFYQGK